MLSVHILADLNDEPIPHDAGHMIEISIFKAGSSITHRVGLHRDCVALPDHCINDPLRRLVERIEQAIEKRTDCLLAMPSRKGKVAVRLPYEVRSQQVEGLID